MNIVESPQYKRGQQNGIGLIPATVHLIDKIIHQGGNAIVFGWGVLVSDLYRTWSVFTGIGVQTRNGVEIERPYYLLRQKPLININSGLNYRVQKLILTIPIGNCQ